jgi:hypothetical protein
LKFTKVGIYGYVLMMHMISYRDKFGSGLTFLMKRKVLDEKSLRYRALRCKVFMSM